MIRNRLAGTLLLTLIMMLLLLAMPSAAMAQGNGVVEGTVTVSGDGELPSGLEVELLFLPNGQGPPKIERQPLKGDGSFRFTDLDPAPQHAYLVRVRYEGEDHMSDVLRFSSGETRKQVELQLFERTMDASALALANVVYILDVRPGGWVVAARYRYQNDGERTIKNEMNPPVQIPLPEGAVDVRFAQEVQQDGLVQMPDGFAYTGPLAPGETSLIFTYFLPYQEGEQTLSFPLGQDAAQVSVLIPDLGQETETSDLAFKGVDNAVEDRPFEFYEGEDLPASKVLTFQFTGLPPAPEPDPSTQAEGSTPPGVRVVPISPLEELPWWVPLVPATLAILGVGLYLVARPAPSAAERRAALRARRDQLIAEIASLDIRFESGSIGEQTHQRQRKTLKRELKEILRRLEGVGSESG